MCRDPKDSHLLFLERGALGIVGNDWQTRLDRLFLENLGKFRKYDGKSVQVLARQQVDPDRPHPFTAAGSSEFNCLLWIPPTQQRAGDILMVDSTNFTTLFGGTDSLSNFWKNLATMK